MSRRIKTVTLFNKNHITVIRRDFVSFDSASASMDSHSFHDNTSECGGDPYGREIKKKSPLGFYYITREKENKRSYPSGKMTVIRIQLSNHEYEITYLTHIDGRYIGDDARPWDMYPGEKAMADHFVTDLMNLLNRIYSLAEDEKLDMSTIRKKSFIDLFGNENGPRYQTDVEKILSHGFDLKESFRKGKES